VIHALALELLKRQTLKLPGEEAEGALKVKKIIGVAYEMQFQYCQAE